MNIKPILMMEFNNALEFFDASDRLNVYINNSSMPHVPYCADMIWWKIQNACANHIVVGYEYNQEHNNWIVYVEK